MVNKYHVVIHLVDLALFSLLAGQFLSNKDTFSVSDKDEIPEQYHGMLRDLFGVTLIVQVMYYLLALAYDFSTVGTSPKDTAIRRTRDNLFSVLAFPFGMIFAALHIMAYVKNSATCPSTPTTVDNLAGFIECNREWILFVCVVGEAVGVHHSQQQYQADLIQIFVSGALVFTFLSFFKNQAASVALSGTAAWTAGVFVCWVLQRLIATELFDQEEVSVSAPKTPAPASAKKAASKKTPKSPRKPAQSKKDPLQQTLFSDDEGEAEGDTIGERVRHRFDSEVKETKPSSTKSSDTRTSKATTSSSRRRVSRRVVKTVESNRDNIFSDEEDEAISARADRSRTRQHDDDDDDDDTSSGRRSPSRYALRNTRRKSYKFN